MDLNHDREFEPIPQNIPEEEPQVDTAWHGVGAGVQEFITPEPEAIPEEPVPEAEPVF